MRRFYIQSLLAAVMVWHIIAVCRAAEGVPPARPADRLADSIGVNIHTHYNDTIYKEFDKLKTALQDMGIRHVRDGLVDSNWTPYYDRLNELGRAGIKTTIITGLPIEKILGAADKLREAIEAFEGPNEINLNGWSIERGQAYQKALYDLIKHSPQWANYPVLSLSYTDIHYAKQLGDLSDWMDQGNIHPYPGGWEPENNCTWMRADLNSGLESARAVCGTKPICITETGYTNHKGKQGHVAVSDDAAGVYLPRVFLNNLSHGIARTFWYELFDLHENPADQESNFGLYRNDGQTPKPAGRAMKNLIGLFQDPGPAFTPGSLGFELSDPNARSMLFQKRSGEFLMAVWRPVSLWDQSRPFGQKLHVDPEDCACQIRFAEPVGKVKVYSGLDTELKQEELKPSETIEVTISERVLIIAVQPAS